ncbi:MAG TPA: hypothetical protein VFR24_05440 [Candidatus Angelobacter sp.]|nr:hypothetical protein [Candidatus Angelobacter sp.]
MPLLEITKTRQLTAMLRLDEKTAELVNQYAAFIHCDDADTVIENALNYVFTKDRDFQEFLKTDAAQDVRPILRVRKVPQPATSKSNGTAASALTSPKVATAESRR